MDKKIAKMPALNKKKMNKKKFHILSEGTN